MYEKLIYLNNMQIHFSMQQYNKKRYIIYNKKNMYGKTHRRTVKYQLDNPLISMFCQKLWCLFHSWTLQHLGQGHLNVKVKLQSSQKSKVHFGLIWTQSATEMTLTGHFLPNIQTEGVTANILLVDGLTSGFSFRICNRGTVDKTSM